MTPTAYRTAPDPAATRMPGGVPFIIGNELAERFSFYGMKGILVVFMSQHLLDASGNPAYMSEERAKGIYHLFTAMAYFFPILGAIISDVWLGKYRTILYISLMYCVGHGCLALMDVGPATGLWDMKPFLLAGLVLIAMGSGGIKPCVSAHVGDQFGTGNKHLLTQVFNWFYFAINLGATSSMLLTPVLLREVGPWLAFGLPGVLMAVATFVFWLGRNRFIHVPPAGWRAWKAETFSPEGRRALFNLAPLFLVFVPVFWALFDQTGSAWVLQADKMNRDLGFVWLPDQIQSVNPILILLGIPFFTYVVYPLMAKFFEPTPLRKIGIGLALTAASFALSAVVEHRMAGKQESIAQQIFADLTTDAAAMADIQNNRTLAERETEDERAMRWTRAVVSAAEMSGWKPAEIAAALGMEGADQEALAEDFKARMEARQPFETDRVAELFAVLGAPGERAGTLNGAVTGARTARWAEARVVGYLGEMPSVLWQFLAYAILTSGEILVSIVCLEFAYTQSPRKMKSFVMGVYFLGVSLGNFYVSGVNIFLDATRRDDGTTPLDGPAYYWFFAGIMAAAWVLYLFWAKSYKGQTYIQGEAEHIAEAQAEAEAPDAR
jgi:proton-dependent oligopeptide transporter, POT family